MKATINCFLPYADENQVKATVEGLQASELVTKIFLLATDANLPALPGTEVVAIDGLNTSATMKKIAEKAEGEFILLYTKYNNLVMGYFALDRFVKLAKDSKAGMLYADYYTIVEGKKTNSPVIDYQFGSLRDDFNFGSVLFFNTADFKKAAAGIDAEYTAAGLYDLRLPGRKNIYTGHFRHSLIEVKFLLHNQRHSPIKVAHNALAALIQLKPHSKITMLARCANIHCLRLCQIWSHLTSVVEINFRNGGRF